MSTHLREVWAKLAGATEMGEVVQAHLGECFGTVNEFVLGRKMRGDASWSVVHGYIQGEHMGVWMPPLHHAFAENTQTHEVYEPATDTIYDGDAFKRLFRPTFDEVFKPGEWERACLWYGHHGPWDGTEPPIQGGKGYGKGPWKRTAATRRLRMWRSNEASMTYCTRCMKNWKAEAPHPDPAEQAEIEKEQASFEPIYSDDPSIGPGSIEVCSYCGKTIVNSLPKDEWGVRG